MEVEISNIIIGKKLFENVASGGRTRHERAKNRSVHPVHEDFEPASNAVIPSAAVLKRQTSQTWFSTQSCVHGECRYSVGKRISFSEIEGAVIGGGCRGFYEEGARIGVNNRL